LEPQKGKEKQEKHSRSMNKTTVNGYKMGELVFSLPLVIWWVPGRSWLLPEEASCLPQGVFGFKLILAAEFGVPKAHVLSALALLCPRGHEGWE